MLAKKTWFKIINLCLIPIFIGLPLSSEAAAASATLLPEPGAMLGVSAPFQPATLKGVRLDPKNPLNIRFIIDPGTAGEVVPAEASRLVRYFLAGLTLPEESLWVNLSLYEQDRVIDSAVAQTDLGRDMLGQDYVLKQFIASLTHPDSPVGRDYWKQTYQAAAERFGAANVPLNTFSKVWITHDQAEVYEYNDTAFISKASLKAMLEQDLLALEKSVKPVGTVEPVGPVVGLKSPNRHNRLNRLNGHNALTVNKVAFDVMREVIVPVITRDINDGANFAALRQIYHSLILAKWFKEKFKASFYKYYINNKNLSAIDLKDPRVKDKIYGLYAEAFKKGLYSIIKKEIDPASKRPVRRRYFSGGISSPVPRHLTVILAASNLIEKLQAETRKSFQADVNITSASPAASPRVMTPASEAKTIPRREVALDKLELPEYLRAAFLAEKDDYNFYSALTAFQNARSGSGGEKLADIMEDRSGRYGGSQRRSVERIISGSGMAIVAYAEAARDYRDVFELLADMALYFKNNNVEANSWRSSAYAAAAKRNLREAVPEMLRIILIEDKGIVHPLVQEDIIIALGMMGIRKRPVIKALKNAAASRQIWRHDAAVKALISLGIHTASSTVNIDIIADRLKKEIIPKYMKPSLSSKDMKDLILAFRVFLRDTSPDAADSFFRRDDENGNEWDISFIRDGTRAEIICGSYYGANGIRRRARIFIDGAFTAPEKVNAPLVLPLYMLAVFSAKKDNPFFIPAVHALRRAQGDLALAAPILIDSNPAIPTLAAIAAIMENRGHQYSELERRSMASAIGEIDPGGMFIGIDKVIEALFAGLSQDDRLSGSYIIKAIGDFVSKADSLVIEQCAPRLIASEGVLPGSTGNRRFIAGALSKFGERAASAETERYLYDMAVQPRRQAQGVAGGDNSGERAEAVLAYANVVRGRAKVFKMLELMATNISDDHSYVARARRLAYVVAANKNLREIIPAMLDLLEHANPVVQEDVVHALGMLRVLEIPAETKDLMIDALTKAGGRSQRLREIVLIALKELGVNEAKVKELGDAITGWGIIREGIIKEGILGKFREFLRSGEPSGEYRHAEGKKTWAVTFRRRKDSDDEGGKDKDGKNVEIYYSFVDDDAREKNKTGDFYIYGVFVAASSAIKVQAEEVTGAAVGLNAAARPAADLRASETRNSLYKFGNYGDTNHRFRIVSSASPMKPVLTVLTTPLTTEQEKRKIKLEIIGEVMRDMAKGSRYAHVDTIIDAADPIFRKQPVLGPDPDVVLLHEDDVFDAVDELKLKSSFVSPCSVNSEGMVSLPLLKTESSVKEREYSEEWRRVTTEHDWREEPISEIMRDEHLNPRSIHRALAAMTADPDYRYRVYVQGGYVVSESKTESNRGKAYPEFNRRDYFVQVLTTGQKAIVERIVGDIAERSEHAHVATIMGAARKAIIAESAMEIEVTESVVEEALDKLYREREKPFPGGSYSHMDYKGIVTLPPASRGNLVRSDYEEMRRMRSRGFKLPIKKIMALESLSPEAVHNTFAAMAADQRYEDIYYVEDGFVKTKKRTNQKEDYPSFDPKAYGVSSSGVAVASSGLAIILADEIDIRLRKALHDTAKRSRRVHQGTIVRDVKEGFKPFKKEMGMDANDDISISDETVQRAVDELDVQLRKFYRNPGMERVFSGDTYLRDPYTGMISLPKSLVKATPDGDPRALSEEWRRIEEYPADIFATPIEEIVKRQGLNPRSVHAALAEMAGDPDSEDIIYVEGGRIKHKPRLQGDQGARYQEYDPKAYGVSSSGVAVTNPLGGIKMSGLQVSAAPGSSPVSFAAIGPEFFKNIIFTIVSLRKAGSLLRFASGR